MKNVYLHHTLKEYNKKYSNLKYRLLKFTKKEVEGYDNKCPYKTKGYILQGRKWWLIKDTYYEVPRAPRYTWFRNLNAGVQTAVCLLGIGAITAAIVTPSVLLSNKTKGIISEIDGTGKDLIKSVTFNKQSDGSYTGKIELKESADPEEIESISILVTENDTTTELTRDRDYTLDVSTGDIKINVGVIKTEKPKITIEVKRTEKTKKYTITAIAGQGGTVSPEEQEYVKGEQATVTATPEQDYRFEGWYEDGQKIEGAEATYIFEVTCKRTLTAKFEADTGELYIEGDDSVGVGDQITLTCPDAIGTVEWDIDDESIATISDAGVVTGVSVGTTTVIAADTMGNRGELEIEVLPYHAYLIIEPYGTENKASVAWNSLYSTFPLDGKVVIPDNVTIDGVTYTIDAIDHNGFQNCDRLTSITLPKELLEIGMSAFMGCTSLTSITIPDSVEVIYGLAFNGCSSLNSAKFEKDVCWIMDDFGHCWETPEHTLKENADALKNISSSQIWVKITEKDAFNFYEYHGFKINEQGEEVETEDEPEYYKICCDDEHRNECTFATIPSKHNNLPVTGFYTNEDGYGAFYEASLLKRVIFEEPCNITKIEDDTFDFCTRLKDITIPDGVTSIGKYAFYNCINLTTLNIPSSVNSIGDFAFYPAVRETPMSLKEVDFEDTITTWTIGDDITDWQPKTKEENAQMIKDHSKESWTKNVPIEAEYDYKGYKVVEGEEVETSDEDAEYFKIKCKDDKVYECEHALIPAYHPKYKTKPITGLSDDAFAYASHLSSVEFKEPSNIKTFGESAFNNCVALKEIKIPESVTRIDKTCFVNCGELTSISIPDSVDYIGENCFASCSNLASVTLEESSKWNIIDPIEMEVCFTYTAGDPIDNAVALTKMQPYGYMDWVWRKFGQKEKFLEKLDELVIGENGFNKSTTEYSTADISEVKINNVDVTNYDVAYYSENGFRWLTISNNDDSDMYFDFGDPYYNSELKSNEFLDSYLAPSKIRYEIKDNYIEYEVDEDYFDDPETNTLRFLRVNKFGYIEKAIIYDDFGEGKKWTEFSVTYNNEPHQFNNVKVEYIEGTTFEAVQTITKDNYYKIKCDEGYSGYEYEFTINNSDGPIDLTTIIEDCVVKDYADRNMSFTLSTDKTKLTIIPDANTDINIRFKCKSTIENAKFKFVVIE